MITSTNPDDIKAQSVFGKWVECSFKVMTFCRVTGIQCSGRYISETGKAYIMALVKFDTNQ